MVRPEWVLSHVRQGTVQTNTRGIRATARSGDVMLHLPHVPFSEHASGAGIHEWIAFSCTVGLHQELFRLHAVSPVVTLEDPAAYSENFTSLERAFLSSERLVSSLEPSSVLSTDEPASSTKPLPVREIQILSCAFSLFSLVLESWQTMGFPPRPPALLTAPDRFQEILVYMAAQLQRPIHREELAKRVFLHPGYFDRAFRAAYGVSPTRMLREMRLRRAQELLVTTEDTLEAIAAACGLGEAVHFSHVFRAQFGQSPGQYRQSAKTSSESYLPTLPE